MKIGFLLTAYNQREYIEDCLKNLVKFAKDGSHLISCVSVPFSEYEDFYTEEDGTKSIVENHFKEGNIDFLFTEPEYISEARARTRALQPLLDCDYVMLVDADEIYSYSDLEKIFEFVENSEFITWWTIPLKNYWGEGYIKEPFSPPRIFKVNIGNIKLDKFYFDNEVLYSDGKNHFSFEVMSKSDIPKSLVWIPHYSWLNNEKTRLKCIYQEKHFAHGAGCSYKWGGNGIEINEEYYKKTGQKKPTIIYEN